MSVPLALILSFSLSILQSKCFSSLNITSLKSNISAQPTRNSQPLSTRALRYGLLRFIIFIYLINFFFHLSTLRGNVRQLIKQLFLCASSLFTRDRDLRHDPTANYGTAL